MGSCVFQCDVPQQWIAQQQVGPCLYTVTGWGVVSCVCGMAFLCGSTLVATWAQMFKAQQTNEVVSVYRCMIVCRALLIGQLLSSIAHEASMSSSISLPRPVRQPHDLSVDHLRSEFDSLGVRPRVHDASGSQASTTDSAGQHHTFTHHLYHHYDPLRHKPGQTRN